MPNTKQIMLHATKNNKYIFALRNGKNNAQTLAADTYAVSYKGPRIIEQERAGRMQELKV